MKKMMIALFFMILFFNLNSAYAEEYKCVYNYDVGKTYRVTFTINTEERTNSIKIKQTNCTFCMEYNSTTILDYELIYSYDVLEEEKASLRKELEDYIYSGKCDTTIMMYTYWSDGAQQDYFKMLLNDNLEAYADEYLGDGSLASGTHIDTKSAWLEFSPDDSTVDGKNYTYACPYDTIYEKLKTIYDEAKNCENGCSNYYSQYDAIKKRMISFCRIQLENLDYKKSCVQSCLNIDKDISKYALSDLPIKTVCGFSERLLAWVSNILRWIKYILPVLVIVLGILDFMKAIGADKEDEMKKAQKRFVTRLIAAALAFIIPLIIEFILTKMGFGYDSCGLF